MAIFTGVLSSKPVDYEEEKKKGGPAADFVVAVSAADNFDGAEQEEFVASGLY